MEKTLEQQLDKLMLSEDLEELNNLTGHFNIFNALKLQNNEIRHSNFLAWIMTPYESHKLGDYFLKEFLKSAIKEYSLNTDISLSLKDIAFLKFDDAEIRREYKNIDLLIVSQQNKFVCIVENAQRVSRCHRARAVKAVIEIVLLEIFHLDDGRLAYDEALHTLVCLGVHFLSEHGKVVGINRRKEGDEKHRKA